MSEQLLALARQDGHLVGIHSVATRTNENEPEQYALAERRVAGDRDVSGPPARRAVAAWRELEAVRLDDPRGLATAVTVLLETVPLGDAGSGATPAGHLWACRPDAWARVRASLAPHAGRVIRLVRAAGFGPHVARALEARDPYVGYHHGALDAPGLLALPTRFRAFVLPLLRGRPWADVSRALALYWALDLAHDDELLPSVVRILIGAREHGPAWLAFLAREQPIRRTVLARLLIASGALAHDPARVGSRAIARLTHHDDGVHANRLSYLLRGVANGVQPVHLLRGIDVVRLAPDWYRIREDPPPRPRHPGVPWSMESDLATVLAHIAGCFDDGRSAFPFALWRWCASHPNRAAVLRRPSVVDWPPATTRALLQALVFFDPAKRVGALDHLDLVERVLARVPVTHHHRAITSLTSALELAGGDARRRAAAIDLSVRLARPPFTACSWAVENPRLLMELPASYVARAVRLPERSLLALDRALLQDHGTQPVYAGLEWLGKTLPAFFCDALANHPQPLLGAARTLGLLHAARRPAVLKRFRAHPVSERGFASRPVEDVCAIVETLVRSGVTNPIPRKLRDHREGRVALSPASLERHRQAIVRRLLPFRIALLRRMALDEMGRGLASRPDTGSERHAVQVLGSQRGTRRLMRRVLALPPGERQAYLESHPASLRWLSGHPRVDSARWATGLTMGEQAEGRPLRLRFETDPAEILRMGSRVGSCLSLGGVWATSAVSAMADVNKRLVVACDAEGRFVARQLVSLTEDDRLVFCRVYPLGIGAAVEDAFERYDRALAAHLGLPIAHHDDYAIANVLGRSSFDDGIWDRFALEA